MSKKTVDKSRAEKKPTASTAVVKAEPKKLPATMRERLIADQGAGMETVTARDIIIPRLTILQVLSPQCQKSKPEFIKGAEPGMFCDTATGELWDGEEGITLLPVKYQLSWLEWAPRKTQKGLVRIHGDDSILKECTKNDKGQFISPEGNNVIETAQFYALNLEAGARQVFISFAGTQRKKAKQWMTLATSERIPVGNGQEIIPPLYYRRYKAVAAMESNDEGEWFGWKLTRGDDIADEDDLYNKAKGYLQAVSTGAMKMSEEQLMREASQEAERHGRREGGRM